MEAWIVQASEKREGRSYAPRYSEVGHLGVKALESSLLVASISSMK